MNTSPHPKQVELASILEEMILLDETISFNAVSRKAPNHFPFASSLSRPSILKNAVEEAQRRQNAVRIHAAKLGKSGPLATAARLSAAEARVRDLEDQNKLLIAGLRASVLAIGRLGGAAAWQEHFPVYSEAFKQLRELGGIPSAEISQLSTVTASDWGRNKAQASTPKPSASAAMLSIDKLRSDRSTDPT